MYYKNNQFLVVGLQKSGYSSAKLLLEKGATVYIYDTRKTEVVENNKQALILLGAKPLDTLEGVENVCNVLVLSPGVPIDSEIVVRFKQTKKRVLGELELGYMQLTTPLIAVTGTNGKTTVCKMLNKALNESGFKCELVGNVGVPITSKIQEINNSDVAVVEVSSFQLETTYAFIPHVSVVLNVTPDHLDRHYTLENYALVKSKIVIPQKESEFAILNYDDETVRSFSKLSPVNVVWFSTKGKVDGAYLDDGNVCYKNEIVFALSDGVIKNVYSLENLLAVVAVLKLMGVGNEEIKSSVYNFSGVEHRCEPVLVKNGVTYVNDSKSTNPASTINALKSLDKPTVLILGGYDKGLSYAELFKEIKNNKNVKNVVVTGQNALSLISEAQKAEVLSISVISGFNDAIIFASRLAVPGDIVMLSPATSSFDEFTNCEERGIRFSEIVKSII